MTPKYHIGMQFRRYGKKHRGTETIVDILTTANSSGDVVKIEYVTTHDFMGQKIRDIATDTTIARSLWHSQQEVL